MVVGEGVPALAPRSAKEATVQTSVQPHTQRDASCAATSRVPTAPSAPSEGVGSPTHAPLFPPRDADAETRRRWLATSPWPEVVFASAGAL